MPGHIGQGKGRRRNSMFLKMIDFFKAQIRGPSVEELLNHPLLDFRAEVNVKTGEVNTGTQTAEYKNLKFIIKGERHINLQGSLHKFYTGGINHNDFTINEIRESLLEFSSTFNIDLRNSILHNLEYGVNIQLSVNPQGLIKSLLNYKGDIIQAMYGEARRTGKQCIKQQYIVKVYNKGWQCKLHKHFLRFEIKVVKMKYLDKYKTHTLDDIADYEKLKLLMNDLVEAFNQILMYDTKISFHDCSTPERKLLEHGRYAEYWQDLRIEDRKRHDYYRRRFRSLTEKYGQNHQSQVAELLKAKANLLLNDNSESLVDLTKNEIQSTFCNREKSLAELTKQQIPEMHDINHSSGMVKTQGNFTSSITKKCEGCGTTIQGRKSTAKYCSEECRILSKNRRRDLRLPLKQLAEKERELPTLFNSLPFMVLSVEQKKITELYSIKFE